MGPLEADRKPLYFISYVRDGGKDDTLVEQFYQDLDHDVRIFAGLRSGPVGFLDVSIELGHRWSPALVNSLSTTQVFIPILSPVYFASDSCGKEWTLFTRRLDRKTRRQSSLSSIIPLLWVPLVVPPIAQEFQYSEAAFGAYEKVKLRSLIREDRYRDEYHSFVQLLAQRIVSLNEGSPVAEAADRPDFDSVPSAFPAMTNGLRPNLPQDKPRRIPVRRPSSERPILKTVRPNEEPS